MLDAGRLRHRLHIQENQQVQNPQTGAMTDKWVTIATVWAAIEDLSVREMIAAQSENSKVRTRIIIRYRNNIDYSMSIYHESKMLYYNIEGKLSDKDSGLEYLTLACSEGLRYKE